MGNIKKIPIKKLASNFLYTFSNENSEKELNIDLLNFTKEKIDLYNKICQGTINKWDFLLEKLKSNSKNWDPNRVFLIDKILIIMASYEMKFLNNPHQIVINEYIDISKIFSSPKSKIFINGILDKIAKDN